MFWFLATWLLFVGARKKYRQKVGLNWPHVLRLLRLEFRALVLFFSSLPVLVAIIPRVGASNSGEVGAREGASSTSRCDTSLGHCCENVYDRYNMMLVARRDPES